MPAFTDFVDAILPARCPACGAVGAPVCAACRAGVRRSPRPAAPPGVDALRAAFVYDGVARELIARLKYRNERGVLPWVAACMAEELDPSWSFDAVTWVPTTNARRSARGFDQAELLARRLSALVGVPARRCLVRGRGAPQTGAPWAQRRLGPALAARGSQRGTDLLVVDDVLTSGATLTRAAAVLRAAGAGYVTGLVAAWRPPRSGAARNAPGPTASHNLGKEAQYRAKS